MIDRESHARSRKPGNAANSADSYDAPIGISKKVIVYVAIMALIAVLCVAYVMQIKRGRSGGSTRPETAAAAAASSEAATGEAAAEQEEAEQSPDEQSSDEQSSDQKEGQAAEEASEGSGEKEKQN